MIGLLVHGCLETFCIADADIPTDLNLELTLVARTLDKVSDRRNAQ